MKRNQAKDNTRSAIDCATPSGGIAEQDSASATSSSPVNPANPAILSKKAKQGDAPAPPVRKRSPQAEARRVAIPFAVVITAFLACCMLTGLLTDKSKAPSRDSTFELVLSIITYIGFLVAIVWGVWCAFRGKGREWRESRARSEAARDRLAGRSARHRAGGRDTLTPADPALSRYRHMKWYHGGPLGEDR